MSLAYRESLVKKTKGSSLNIQHLPGFSDHTCELGVFFYFVLYPLYRFADCSVIHPAGCLTYRSERHPGAFPRQH